MTDTGTRILISACLWGCHCRHDGRSAARPEVRARIPRAASVMLVCPEEFAGLGTPRTPFDLPAADAQQILSGRVRVLDHEGKDISDALLAGLHRTLELVEAFRPERAILKDGSPSCGVRTTWIKREKTTGKGLLTVLLEQKGVPVEGVD